MQGTYMPLGLKNKMVNTTTTKVKIDHTVRSLLTHTVPPESPEKYTHFFGGGEGFIWPSLPRVDCVKVLVVELLLYDRPEVYQCATKINKYD